MSKLRCTCLLFLLLALVAGVPTAPSAADAEKLQSEAEHNMRQADATIEQLQTDMKRMDTFAEEVRRNLDEEARAKQDLSHALGYFHRQMQLSSDERDVSHSRVSRLEAEVVALQRKVHQLEGQVETCHKDKVSAGFCRRRLPVHPHRPPPHLVRSRAQPSVTAPRSPHIGRTC
jgi:outer membrane murein-binding lipoprotein Lpp